MSSELDRVRRFLASTDDLFADRRVPLPVGTALFYEPLPLVWDLNFVRLERDAPLDVVLAETELVQAGLAHRKVKTPFEPRAVPQGWKMTSLLVMVHRGPAPEADPRVEEVEAEALRSSWAASAHEDPDTARQLVAARFLRNARTGARYFAAAADGRYVSDCTLFFDGTTAEVDSVGTMEPYRGRGLAKAVVGRAVSEARRGGHDLVFLIAEENDWPKELYRRLGFEEIGRTWELLREPQP
jgi:GNAT superfamily N-acetyltransferase